MSPLVYWHVDVFANRPLAGNGLAIFPDASGLPVSTQQKLTQELRQYESIFLEPRAQANTFGARIFTMEEELPFAGHPLIGAAALLHHQHGQAEQETWRIELSEKTVTLMTHRAATGYYAEMDQGLAQWGCQLDQAQSQWFAHAFSLRLRDLDADYPPMVVSTGLPYLILPVKGSQLGRARIAAQDLEARLHGIGAAFVYVLDVERGEGRSWDNAGLVEDIATGSAAGAAAAYLVRHGCQGTGKPFVIHQGGFTGRPSQMDVSVDEQGAVRVGGHVHLLSRSECVVELRARQTAEGSSHHVS
ncbi:PhzF family phenazine biosynthesis protein [Pseudomonas luteola]|uniref:PhzF family phenazine biosynthesis protein n=1 Tax=Pseudomonas luteola TaxID=47886 RepID=UPI0002D4B3B7|nr:PhzF family phenazine biosynthesis protein [Pseudomonas luteola]RRW46578.1 PhzF family phenazine biosynthesis protein [Pseudomonas luteola]